MNRHFSLYLDLVRFGAAVLVVLSHYFQHEFVSKALAGSLPELGREAVIVFFVLSGFVIAYASERKTASLRQYIVARCARIYSVALPILLVAFAVFIAVNGFAQTGTPGEYQVRKLYIYLPLHLLFAGELWNLSETPPWLAAYWSLGYEVWYYVLFGAIFFGRGLTRVLLVAVILLVMGHKLWLLLPVWMSGVFLYRFQRELPISQTYARLGCVATVLAILWFNMSGAGEYLRALGNSIWPFPGLKLGSADRFLADYAVCVLVYLHLSFARQANITALAPIATPLRAVAAYTFTLYLIHMPVLYLWRRFYAHDSASLLDVGMLSVAIGLTCYIFGFVTERQKTWFVARFDGMFGHLLRLIARLGLHQSKPESADESAGARPDCVETVEHAETPAVTEDMRATSCRTNTGI